jgi:hypothetical protein
MGQNIAVCMNEYWDGVGCDRLGEEKRGQGTEGDAPANVSGTKLMNSDTHSLASFAVLAVDDTASFMIHETYAIFFGRQQRRWRPKQRKSGTFYGSVMGSGHRFCRVRLLLCLLSCVARAVCLGCNIGGERIYHGWECRRCQATCR